MSRPREVLARRAPGLVLLRSYRRTWLGPDVLAGLTVGAMLVPQCMAYAELAGLEPVRGFYAVLVPLVLYALVGSSRHLGVGPEPGTAILAATGIAPLAAGDAGRYVALMALLAVVVGALCLGAAALRLGFVASALSKPVLVGYITGVGLVLLSSQLSGLTGVPIDRDSFFGRLQVFVTNLGDVRWRTLAVGLGTLVVILVLRRVAQRVPGALAGVVGATIAVALLGLDERGVAVVGDIPSGLPRPSLPDVAFADLRALLPVAAGIALVGFTDNVLTARSIASKQGYEIDANQELFALGLNNLGAGCTSGFPVSSSASRSATPAALGSRTQLVSLVGAAVVAATLLGLGGALAEIPRAALAAVIVAAAIAIIDLAGYRSLWVLRRDEFALAVLTAAGVVVLDVLLGVIVAVVLSLLVALSRIGRPHDAVLGEHPGEDGWVDLAAYPGAVAEPGLVVYRFDAPLFFVNVDRFRRRVEEALASSPGAEEWVVLDFEGIGAVDSTAVDALHELVDHLGAMGATTIGVARANDEVLDLLGRAQLCEPAGPLRVFPTINGAVRAFRSRR